MVLHTLFGVSDVVDKEKVPEVSGGGFKYDLVN